MMHSIAAWLLALPSCPQAFTPLGAVTAKASNLQALRPLCEELLSNLASQLSLHFRDEDIKATA